MKYKVKNTDHRPRWLKGIEFKPGVTKELELTRKESKKVHHSFTVEKVKKKKSSEKKSEKVSEKSKSKK